MPYPTIELDLNKFKKSNTEGKLMERKNIKTFSINIKVMEDSEDDDDDLVSLQNFIEPNFWVCRWITTATSVSKLEVSSTTANDEWIESTILLAFNLIF